MPKNIIICCDGTNCEFGKSETNVLRLYQCLDRSVPSEQLAFYDPGVGTIASPGLKTKVGRTISRAISGAFGAGISENVRDVFRFLMVHYQPGDQVYMFGFSRGAYTVRMAAGMLHECGLPRHGNEGLLPYASRIYKHARKRENKRSRVGQDTKGSSGPECRDKSDSNDIQEARGAETSFKATFSQPCRVQFLGLWDTVSTVGIMINPQSFPHTAGNKEVAHIRHALALDERRGFFRTNRWTEDLKNGPDDARTLMQAWFPGVHSDVGGGYREGSLWKHPFRWMVEEAKAKGLKFDQKRLDDFLSAPTGEIDKGKTTIDSWHRTEIHESTTLAWKLAGIFPKRYKREIAPGQWEKEFCFSFPKLRGVKPEELIHRSILERWRDLPAWRPSNLDAAIIGAMLARLQPGDEFLPYQP